MKRIYLIGFRGTGSRSEQFKREPLLIRVGHVGFAFEGDENRVYGFHPTLQAAQAVGDDETVIAWLKRQNTLPGLIHDDTAIFRRAHELARDNARTTVWQMTLSVPDDEFDRIQNLTLLWYTERKEFTYSFPAEELLPDRDNCATFPRRLGLALPEETGQLFLFVAALAEYGEVWPMREDDDDRPSQ